MNKLASRYLHQARAAEDLMFEIIATIHVLNFLYWAIDRKPILYVGGPDELLTYTNKEGPSL